MALTNEQEDVLEEMIEAYLNGKRVIDLPDVQGENPFEMRMEVVDEDGESKQASLAHLLPYSEIACAYGVEIDRSDSSAELTRVGNMDLHVSCPIQSRMKGCLLDDDGNVAEYLNPRSWLNHDRSGARGQVMVEIPYHWRKFTTEGTKLRTMISEYPIPGYHFVPTMYVSAYHATVERSTNKLSSVVNYDEDYRGGNNTSSWDGTYRSLLGRPATNISRTNFRNYARNRKSGSTQWNAYVYDAYKAVCWLFMIEYATRNCQLAYNAEKTQAGYHQGGLGDGVSNWTSSQWEAFNNYYPFVPCGYTDEFGNGTGVKAYTASNGDDIELTSYVPRYRGIENPFGHIFSWIDGVNVEVQSEEAGGESKVYVCHNPANFIDNGYTNYIHAGNEARQNGYTKDIVFGEEGDIFCSEIGAGSSTYYCDYHYASIPGTGTSLRGLLFGGDANRGAVGGFVCSYSHNAPSYTTAYIGSRLCFIR